MSSLLARQLEAHRATNPLPPPADAKKSRPSILFKDKANTLDAKQILDIGRNGLQRLCGADAKFKKYQTTIFSTALGSDTRSERQLLPKAERESVDSQCRELLLEVSPHLASEAGKQVLEFLIQRYYVHIYNPEALFCAVLPYHETELFTDVANLPSLAISNTRWAFLTKVKLDARGLTRAYLVQVASKDISVFEEICKASCVHNPRFFAAFALECFERLSQSSSTLTQLESTVSVVTRSALESLKIDTSDNIMAACAVIGTMSRLTFLANEACEAFLIVLVKRLDSLRKASLSVDSRQECCFVLAKCLVQMFEWQSRQSSTQDKRSEASIFRDQERWLKFEKYLLPNIAVLIEAEKEKASKIIDEACIRTVVSLNGEWLTAILALPWTGEIYFERAAKVLQVVFSTILKPHDESVLTSLRRVVEVLGHSQSSAFEVCLVALAPEIRSHVLQKCFPDGNSSLAIRLVPFVDDMNLPLAIRDGRVSVRLNALKHLEESTKKIETILFEVGNNDGEECIGLLLARNYLELEVRSGDADQEFLHLIRSYLKVRGELLHDMQTSMHLIARQALEVCKANSQVCELLVQLLSGGASEDSNGKKKGKKSNLDTPAILDEEDLFALVQVAIDDSYAPEPRSCAQRAVEHSWLSGITNEGFGAKTLFKVLKKEPGEEVERKIFKLAKHAPAAVTALLEEAIRTDADFPAASWLLSLLETGRVPLPSSLKAFAQKLLESNSFDELSKKLIECTVPAWQNIMLLFAELVSLSSPIDVKAFLDSGCQITVNDSEKDERRIVRSLRFLRAQQKTTEHGKNGHQLSAEKSAVALLPLLGALRHPKRKQIRIEALNVLALIPTRLTEVLIARRGELERDATAVDRALSRDDQLRGALEKQALLACKDSNFSACRAALECLNDSVLASKILLQVFSASTEQTTINEEVGQLIIVAFNCLRLDSTKSVDAKVLCGMSEKGVQKAPSATLAWMSENISILLPTDGLLDALLGVAEGAVHDAGTISPAVETVEMSGFILTRLPFEESQILSRLKHIKQSVTVPQSAKKKKNSAAQIDENNPMDPHMIRRLSVLVDMAAAHPPRSWALVKELVGLLQLARDRQAGLLEQTVMSSLERNASSLSDADTDAREAFCESMIQEANNATSAASRWTAIRTFCKSNPSFDSFAKAFASIADARSLDELAEAITSNSPTQQAAIPGGSSLIPTFCQSIRRLQPENRLQLLRSFAARCASPADLIAQWLRLSGNDADCSAIASQFKSSTQTDILIKLVNDVTSDSAVFGFTAKHLASQAFLLALIERDDSDISQFIELFEGLLGRVLECEATEEIVENQKEKEENLRRGRVLETALDNLSVLLNVPVFIPVVTEILQNSDAKVRLLALRVLKTKIDEEYSDWKQEEARYVVEFAETLLSWLADGDAKHTTVLAVNSLASVLAAAHKDVFARIIPELAKILGDKRFDTSMQSAACLCLGTILKHVSTLALPHLASLIPKLISGTHASEEVLRQASLTALKDIIESKVPLGSLLSNILQDVALTADDDDLLHCIGQNIEVRVGFPLCLQALRSDTSFTRSLALFDLLVSRTGVSEAVVHLSDLKELSMESLKRAHSVRAFDSSVIVKVGLLLSEKRLKELIESLVTFAEEAEEADPEESSNANATVDALLETIRALTEKCGTLFLPILPFEFVLNAFTSIVRRAKAASTPMDRSKSNKKRQKMSAGDSISPLQISLETGLRCLSECLAHAISTAYVDNEKFEGLVPPLVLALQTMPVDFTSQFVEPAFASLAHCVLSSSQANAMLQTLHHAVTKLLKSESAQTRQAALSCIKTLFERVGNDYLVLMPDTLPFLAELLEDKDESVRVLAQKVALVLRDLSGEDISEFLK